MRNINADKGTPTVCIDRKPLSFGVKVLCDTAEYSGVW